MRARALSAVLLMLTATGAVGADSTVAPLPVKAAAQTRYDWTGFYVGGHFGYGWGSLGPGANAIPSTGTILPTSVTGLIGGFQAGYNLHLPNSFVVGLETDVTFQSPIAGSA